MERSGLPRAGAPSFLAHQQFDGTPTIPPAVIQYDAPVVTTQTLPYQRYIVRDSAVQVPWASSITAIYKSQLNDSDGDQMTLKLLASGLSPGTIDNYGPKFQKFVEFCNKNQLNFLPATPLTVARYLGHIACQGTVKAKSLQPYLSAINAVHRQLALPAPAKGPLIQQARKGLQQVQTRNPQYTEPEDERICLPPSVVYQLLLHGLAAVALLRLQPGDTTALLQLRDCTALVTTFLFFGRSDTGAGVEASDLQLQAPYLVFKERRFKGRTGILGTERVLTVDCTSMPEVPELISAYLQHRPADSTLMWRLPQDRHQWNSTVIDNMLQRQLRGLHVVAPTGYKYTSHSLRKGAASGAYAQGVTVFRICHYGGWSATSGTVYTYIDPTLPPSPSGAYFFGWLVRNHQLGGS